MRGSFTTGGGPPTPPPLGQAADADCDGRSGSHDLASQQSWSTRDAAEGRRYRIVVRDRSTMHNFHLSGPGVNKRTTARFRGTATWTVTFRKGRTYRFVCDPHAKRMKGSFRAT